MIDDRETALRESAEITAALAEIGIAVDRLVDLRESRIEYRTALPILWSGLRRAISAGAACELMWAIACQAQDVDTTRALIDFARPLRGISFDLYTQLREYRYLRGHRLGDRLPTQEELQQAQYAVENAWYRSYECPEKRGAVRVQDPSFPDQETLDIDAESHLLGMGLGNVLLWRAQPELFDDVAGLMLDVRFGFGRSLLPAALAQCDCRRAPELLIKVLIDSDIGADAIEPLGKLKYQPARPYLERFLEHPIERVRKWAAIALRRLDQAAGRRSAAPSRFEEVLPQSERMLGAKLTAAEGEDPQDFNGKVSAFVIGCLAEEERGWSREHCACRTFGLDELETGLSKIAGKFNGDLAGESGKALLDEILHAKHEDWKAYKLKVLVGGRTEEIWLHYYLDDPMTIDLNLWGPREFVAELNALLPEE